MTTNKSSKDDKNKNIVTLDDLNKAEKSLIEKLFKDVSKAPKSKQVVFGASSGWLTGLLAMKVGKTAALALGGGIILLQIANEKGYIHINWDKVKSRMKDRATGKVDKKGNCSTWIEQVKIFARNNTPFTVGYVGGFFLGLAFH